MSLDWFVRRATLTTLEARFRRLETEASTLRDENMRLVELTDELTKKLDESRRAELEVREKMVDHFARRNIFHEGTPDAGDDRPVKMPPGKLYAGLEARRRNRKFLRNLYRKVQGEKDA